jgi:hypothetical protein
MQDLEIYIRDLEPSGLEKWLSQHVEALILEKKGSAIKGRGDYLEKHGYQRFPIGITVYRGIYGKRFSSLLLEGDSLPWQSDLECARSAWEALNTEIGCSPGDWREGDEVGGEQWWRLDEQGEQKVAF